MNIFIKELVSKSGEKLVNVPANISVLMDMGFEQAEAMSLCSSAVNTEKLAKIRRQRDYLIAKTDWTQVSDVPLTIDKKTEFAVYRQTLRDLPQSTDNPDNIVWPVKPELPTA